MDEFQEILQDFLIESFELLEQLDQDLVLLETNPEDLELLNRIFRVAHTVKGASSFLNFDVLTHLTHHMEDILNKARHGDLLLTPDVMDVVLESIDLMKELLNTIRDTGADAGVDVSMCVVRLDAKSNGTSVTESPKEESREEETEEEELEEEAPEEEPDYDNMSDAEVEAEIERLLAQRQVEDQKKRKAKQAAGEAVPQMPQGDEEEPKKEPVPQTNAVVVKPPMPPKRQTEEHS